MIGEIHTVLGVFERPTTLPEKKISLFLHEASLCRNMIALSLKYITYHGFMRNDQWGRYYVC
jgi:hypothetical protein